MIDRSGNGLAFLLSLPRSGSTLLSAIFSGHESIHAPNEPWILLSLSSLYDLEPSRCGTSRSRHDDAWALRAMKDFLTHEQFTQAAREFAFSAYQSSLSTAGKTFFIDKTPRYFHILPWLDELFPSSGKIWLKRNPLDVAASYLTTWGDTPEHLTGIPLVPASFDLTIGLKKLADYADKCKSILEVRYEDIATDPFRVIEQICAHLKVPYQEGMVEYVKSGNLAERQSRALGDTKLYEHSAPHAGSIGRWEKVLEPAGVQRLVDYIGAAMFERMGYPETVARLKSMGIRFPSEAELSDRHAEILGKTLDSPVSALDGVINLARRYYKEARKQKFPPWFLTPSGLRARGIKKKLVAARESLLLLRKERGEE